VTLGSATLVNTYNREETVARAHRRDNPDRSAMHRAITNPSRLPARRGFFATVKVLRRGLSDDVAEGNKHSDIQNSDDLSLPFRRIQSENDRILESLPVTFADISRAHVQIKGGVRRTPCEKAQFLSELLGANIYLKTELQQFSSKTLFKKTSCQFLNNEIVTYVYSRVPRVS